VTQRAFDARHVGDYFAALCDIPGIASAALREEKSHAEDVAQAREWLLSLREEGE